MTISRIPYDLEVTCDKCGDTLLASDIGDPHMGFTAFTDALDDGWKLRKVADGWVHSCVDCVTGWVA